jgi:hypothetical protein
MPFTNFNGIQQTTANSCGAFALAGAMDNFGIPLPNQNAHLLNTANLAQGFNQAVSVVSNAGGPAAFGNSIYAITGNLLLDLTVPDASYQYTAPVSNMNSPSALAYVATLFGFATVIYYDPTGHATFNAVTVNNPTGQGNLFDTELAIIGTQPAITVTPSPAYITLPAANQVHMLLVNNNHWVAINNTQLYDPATGYVGVYNVNPLPLQTISYMHNGVIEDYDFSGIWIQVQ